MADKDYLDDSAARMEHESFIAEERRKWNNKKATARQLEQEMQDYIQEVLESANNKKSLGEHGLRVMENAERGIDPIRDTFKNGLNNERFGGEADDVKDYDDLPAALRRAMLRNDEV